jgi:dynein heavy chain
LESLKECLVFLDVVEKGLSDYLETKRMVFPRFFFLSDDELLEIIIQSKEVQAVQPHLKKCFENIRELKFETDLRITKMYSAEYEEVVLQPSIYPKGNVEDWLVLVEKAMRNTLRMIIKQALDVVEQIPRDQWVYMWPGQVVLCGGQTYWTAHVEEGIRNDALPDYYKLLLQQVRNTQMSLSYKRSRNKHSCRERERKRVIVYNIRYHCIQYYKGLCMHLYTL